jgi:hypothetical protein
MDEHLNNITKKKTKNTHTHNGVGQFFTSMNNSGMYQTFRDNRNSLVNFINFTL